MPSPALLQAIDRLDKAVADAETALASVSVRTRDRKGRRNARIAAAMGEIDDLIAALKDDRTGEADNAPAATDDAGAGAGAAPHATPPAGTEEGDAHHG